MSKKNLTPEMQAEAPAKKKKKGSGWFGRLVRRFFLLLFTIIFLAAGALILLMNLVFNGPSIAMQERLTMSLIEASATKWVPALFIGEERVAEIRTPVDNAELSQDVSTSNKVVIEKNNALTATSDEWANYPDGIRIERYAGDTYNAHIMIVRDPSTVYMGTSTEKYSTAIPGKRITEMMDANPDAIAAVNAGAFFDDGTTSTAVGSYPLGLTVSKGETVWSQAQGIGPGLEGFAGFNSDNELVVVDRNLTAEEAEALDIRDGVGMGPALIIDREVQTKAEETNTGYNPRTAIGQREDGTVILMCINGRQADSLGATYADVINEMMSYGADSACLMQGGSASAMMYRPNNTQEPQLLNALPVGQNQPRRLPTYWMVSAE